MDAQQEHDQGRVKLTKKGLKGSKKRLEALLKKKATPTGGSDPIAGAMKRNPGQDPTMQENLTAHLGVYDQLLGRKLSLEEIEALEIDPPQCSEEQGE